MYVKTYKSAEGGLGDEEKDQNRKSKHLGNGDCFCPHVCISWNSSMELGRVHAIEYKAMRLVVGTTGFAKEAWPEEVQKVTLTQQEVCMSILVILVIAISIMIRRLIVQPLLSYNQSIKNGEIFG